MPEKKKKYLTRDQRDNRTAWIMLAPALLFLAVMIAYPLGKVIHDAFSQVNLIKPMFPDLQVWITSRQFSMMNTSGMMRKTP